MNRLKKNDLIITDYDKPNIIDLVRTIYNYCGTNYSENTNELKIINDNKNIIFILVDGLGYNLINSLNENSILKRNCKTKLNTVFPSATGCVLNCVASAEYPSKTGLFGWYGYNRENNISYNTLLLTDRNNNENLQLNDNDIFKCEPVYNKFNRNVNIIYPDFLLNTRFSKHIIGNNNCYGYNNYENAFKYIKEIITKNDKPTFTYLYLPEIDTLEHQFGVFSENVYLKINELEEVIQKFVNENDNYEIILTADHGQTNIDNIVTMDFSKYNKYFYALPSIDLGTATYFIKEDYALDFEKEFNNDFEDKMLLYKTDDLINNNFFGKNMTDYSKSCLGEYISICKKGYAFFNDTNKYDENRKIKGNHTGLTKDEMEIPLIIIGGNYE